MAKELQETLNIELKDYGLAHPMDRLAAFFVDIIVLFPVVQVLHAPYKRKILNALVLEEGGDSLLLRLSMFLIFSISFVIYNWLAVYFFSQTLGKKFFSIKVYFIRGESDLFLALLRSVSSYLQFLFIGLPYLAMFTNRWRRPLHDRVADSVVISKIKPSGYPTGGERRRAYALVLLSTMMVSLFSVAYLLLLRANGENSVMAGEPIDESCQAFRKKYDEDIERAIESFSTGKIGSECLRVISSDLLWKNQNKAMANLGNALAYSDDEKISNVYMEEVCRIDPEGSPCLFVEWTQRNPLVERPFLPDMNKLLADKELPDFFKMYFISALQKHKLYDEASRVIKEIRNPVRLGDFLSIATFRSLMWQGDWSSAYWVYKLNEVPEDNFVDFIETSLQEKTHKTKDLHVLIEKFYPGLQVNKGSRGLASAIEAPAKIKMLWIKLGESR